MGLFLRQDEQRSDVQKRVATELQERLRQPTVTDDDPATQDDRHLTRPAGMAIIVLAALLCVAVIVLAIRIS